MASDPLFDSGSDWFNNACVGFDRHSWIGQIEGFRRAGDILVREAMKKRSNLDFLIYPIVYNYRHALEARLKSILRHGGWMNGQSGHPPISHRLDELFDQALALLRKAFPKENLEELVATREVIAEFQKRIHTRQHSSTRPTETGIRLSRTNKSTFAFFETNSRVSSRCWKVSMLGWPKRFR